VAEAEAETAHCDKMVLTLALSYGGRREIIHAVSEMLRDGVNPDFINETTFRAYLYAPDIPDPDLLIRTSGELRISNFLLWQIAYSEFYVTETLWPDFGPKEFRAALDAYAKRQRRFGLTDDQIEKRKK
jgi:undecaprenyl diphosphate synthase